MLRFSRYLLVALASLVIQIEGSCFRDILHPSTTIDPSGNNVTENYCEYLNEKRTFNTNWSYPYPTCFSCECNTYGLLCCGYGVKAGVIQPPEGCQLAKGTCDIKLVKINDTSKPCFDTASTTFRTTTKKKKCLPKRKNYPCN